MVLVSPKMKRCFLLFRHLCPHISILKGMADTVFFSFVGNNVDFFVCLPWGQTADIFHSSSLCSEKSCNLLCVPRLLQRFPELPRNSSAECVLTSSRAFVILFSNRSPLLPPFAARSSVGQNLCPPPSQKKSRLGWGAVLEGEGGEKTKASFVRWHLRKTPIFEGI